MGPRSNACLTCRSRKVKCDRSLPTCSACRRLNLECLQQDAVPRLMWLEPGSFMRKPSRREGGAELPEREIGLRRKPLFTDRNRIAECDRMASRLPDQSIEDILQQIDVQTEHRIEHDDTLEFGPFAVFATKGATPLSESEEKVSKLPSLPEEIGGIWGCLGYSEQPPQETQSIIAKSPFQVPWEAPSSNFLSGDGIEQMFTLDANDNVRTQEITDLARFFSLDPWSSPPLPSAVPITYSQDVGDMAPSVMRSLLDHYQYSMMSSFIPFHHAKPPWKILHLPCAVSTSGDLALLGNSNNAKMTLLFAIFAMSAFNLSHSQTFTDESQDWNLVAELYRDRAKARLKICLQEQGSKVKKAKYKEVLMALLSMVTVCVVSGQMQEARCFLLDAERFICLQSLRKHRKSRKVNMLHSIYLYLRIIEESTFTSASASDTQPFLADYTCSVSETTPTTSCRYPSLWIDRMNLSSNLDPQTMVDLESRLVKFPVDADEPTMFEQIYGIPESLFRLISHATHMADAVRRSRLTDPNSMAQELAQSAKLLESKICDWKNPHRLLAKVQTLVIYGPAESSKRVETRSDLLFDFLESMHSALIIYFYRRVRNVNAVALQHWVGRTIRHLLEHERKKIKYGDTSGHVAWPGFIAACEALDSTHREQISAFLFRAGQSSGLRMFYTARDVASRVWTARDQTGNIDISWSDILTASKDGLVLS